VSKVVRKESSIQKAVVDYARNLGMIAIKQSTLGRFGTSGWPDYLFITRRGRAFMVEFKAAGGVLSPLQRSKMDDLLGRGFVVYLIDNVVTGKHVIDVQHGLDPK
jgi:hypothetical protein